MSEDPIRPYETSLERFRGAILRAFPLWFRWLLSALVLTWAAYISWDVFRFFGFQNGQWVTGSRWGAHFDGGRDVMFLLIGALGAVYSWGRLILLCRDSFQKRNAQFSAKMKSQSEQAGASDGDKPPI